MTVDALINNVINERLYGLPCTTCGTQSFPLSANSTGLAACKISEHFISLYPACSKVSSWVEPVCTEDTLTETLTCTSAIAPVADASCSPTITIL